MPLLYPCPMVDHGQGSSDPHISGNEQRSRRGRAVCVRSLMAYPDHMRRVPSSSQVLRNRHLFDRQHVGYRVRESSVDTRVNDIATRPVTHLEISRPRSIEACTVSTRTGTGSLHNGGARRRADGLHVVILQPTARCGQCVKIGCVDDVLLMAIHLRVIPVRKSVTTTNGSDAKAKQWPHHLQTDSSGHALDVSKPVVLWLCGSTRRRNPPNQTVYEYTALHDRAHGQLEQGSLSKFDLE